MDGPKYNTRITHTHNLIDNNDEDVLSTPILWPRFTFGVLGSRHTLYCSVKVGL